jgi:hypothetical protein
MLTLVCCLLLQINCIASQERNCETIFSTVYDEYLWGQNEDGSPSSGSGSRLQNILPYKDYLVCFLKKNQIQSVVDVGCGDWVLGRQICWDHISYTGIDVVKKVIERNQKMFAKPNITFLHQDLLRVDLPPADLLVCKDVLQHLSNADVFLFLQKIKKFKHCLITNDIVEHYECVRQENRDLVPNRGVARPLDLTKPPFNLKAEKVLLYQVGDDIKQVLYIKN